VIRQSHLIAVVGAFLVGCAVLLLVAGCAGVLSKASEEQQGHTEATKKEQPRSPEATATEEARCGETRTFKEMGGVFTTNDLPGCPNGGLLSGTDGLDWLAGKDGEDEVRGLSGRDLISGGIGNDVIYGGPGDDFVYGGDGDDEELYGDHDYGDQGEDVIYGGEGNDTIYAWNDGQRDRLYCGEGIDHYAADKFDYVDGSCEKKTRVEIVS
jgi:uncharacterized protein YceK